MMLAATLLALAAAPASAGLSPSTPDMVVAAAVDCWEAVNATAVDETALRSKGWAAAAVTSSDGKPVEPDVRVFGKSGTNAVLMLSARADPHGCIVVSRVNTPADVSASAQLLLQRLIGLDAKVEGKRVSGSEVGYFLLPKAALLRATGTKDRPGASVQVSYTTPEKK